MPALLITCGKYFVFKPFISFENLYEHSIKCSFFSEKALGNEKKRTTASKYDNDLLCTRVSANIAHEQKSTLVRKLRKHKRRDIRDQVSKISARWRNHVNYLLLEELESIYGKGELSKVLTLKSRWHVSTANISKYRKHFNPKHFMFNGLFHVRCQPAFTYSKSMIRTPGQCV